MINKPLANALVCEMIGADREVVLKLAQLLHPEFSKRIWRAQNVVAKKWRVYVSEQDTPSSRPPGGWIK